MEDKLTKIKEAASYIAERLKCAPRAGLILGSGLGVLADEIEEGVRIPYEEIPHFPVSTVAGHAGRLAAGILNGTPVIAMQGRFHYYEGYSMSEVTFPVYVMKKLGVETLIVTNAAGSADRAQSGRVRPPVSRHVEGLCQRAAEDGANQGR